MRKLIFVLLFVVYSIGATAQENTNRITYGGMQQMGMAIEANNVKWLPNFINGVRYNRWFAGIGIGYEISETWFGGSGAINTMPLYLDGRYYFFKKKWVFVLADVGTNLIVGNSWMHNDQWDRYKKYVGYYGNLGAGVKARLGSDTYYSFDVSYNFKQTRYDHEQKNGVNLWTREENDFRQRRILVRMGIEIL